MALQQTLTHSCKHSVFI